MEIISRGTVCQGDRGTERQSCAFPGVCVLPRGRWLCGFRAAPTKAGAVGQHALLTWSDDEGRHWREPVAPFTPPEVEGRPGLFRAAYTTSLGGSRVLAALCWVDHSDPALPFFNEETEGLLDTRIFLAWSEDAGETWSEPRLMDTAPFHQPTPLTGPVLLLPDGRLACQFELNKHYYDPEPWRHASVLLLSSDGGHTWPEHSIASSDPENRVFYWDQRPAVLPDGRVLDLFWTYDNALAVYRNIHAREAFVVAGFSRLKPATANSLSRLKPATTNGGLTWSALWDTGVPGQPAQPVALPDGRVAMVYVDRTGVPAIKARASADGGHTWPEETELTLYQAGGGLQTTDKGSMEDAWAEMSRFSVGLPATAPLPNGDVLVVYYAGPETDHTSIEWVRTRME